MPKFIVKPDSSNTYLIRYVASGFQTIHGRSPYPNEETGTWFYFNDETEKFVDSEIPVRYDDEWIKEKLTVASMQELMEYLGISEQNAQDGGEQVDGQ